MKRHKKNKNKNWVKLSRRVGNLVVSHLDILRNEKKKENYDYTNERIERIKKY